MAFRDRAALAIVCLMAARSVSAGDMCPAPAPLQAAYRGRDRRGRPPHPDRQRRRFSASTGFAVLNGHVQVHQDQRTMPADPVTYDKKTGR